MSSSLKVFKALQLVSMRTSNVDKCFYNPNDKKVLPKHKIEIWPGYVFTVEEYEGGVYLQVSKIHIIILADFKVFTLRKGP